LRRICDIEENEPPYGIAVLSRFRKRVGPEKLMRIVDHVIETLVEKRRIKGETVAMDSTFIKACSRRNLDNRTGYSDPESRVGRAVKTRDLGYRLHLTVDCRSEMPIAMTVAPANENEKKHSLKLFEKASCHVKPERLVADPQYSSEAARRGPQARNGACHSVPEKPAERRQRHSQNRQEIQEPRTSRTQKVLQEARRGRTSVQQTQEPRRLNPAQPERTGQNNVPRSALPAHHALHSTSRHQHAQTKQIQKHKILRKLI